MYWLDKQVNMDVSEDVFINNVLDTVQQKTLTDPDRILNNEVQVWYQTRSQSVTSHILFNLI